MTAFDLCRQRPELELTPVLRIVKYLGLDSSELDDGEVDRVLRLYPFFREDPELVVGNDDIAAETDLEPEAVEAVLHERRRDIPYLGTAARPMVPRVALPMIRAAVDGRDPLEFADDRRGRDDATDTEMHPDTDDEIRTLDRRLEEVVAELRSMTRKIDELTEEIRRNGSDDGGGADAGGRRRQHRRRGGGKPDTIVEACRLVLDDAGGPMKVAEITREVLSQGVEINAKNPNVTVSSILSSYEVFRRVKRGYYVLTS